MIRIESVNEVNYRGQVSVGYLRCHRCDFKKAYRSESFVFHGCPECGGLISLYIGERPDWFTKEDPPSNQVSQSIFKRIASMVLAAIGCAP